MGLMFAVLLLGICVRVGFDFGDAGDYVNAATRRARRLGRTAVTAGQLSTPFGLVTGPGMMTTGIPLTIAGSMLAGDSPERALTLATDVTSPYKQLYDAAAQQWGSAGSSGETPPDINTANDPDQAAQFQRIRRAARMLGRAGTFRYKGADSGTGGLGASGNLGSDYNALGK